MSQLHIGLIVNPLAGLGGSLALKGSDGEDVRKLAARLDPGALTRSMERVQRTLKVMTAARANVRFSAWDGAMGARILVDLGLLVTVPGRVGAGLTTARDTRSAARALAAEGVDILLFAGGDGTARDIFDAVGDGLPVLGVPAGVKMHSGVFAVSPEAAGELLVKLASGGLVGLLRREVRDIDEEAFRHDVVKSRFYGEMLVPGDGSYLQATKVGGRESHELVAAEIASWIVEEMEPDRIYLIGPGSTTAAIMEELDLPNTLLGVDAVRDGTLLLHDANERDLLALLAAAPVRAEIVVTAIGGQGHIFGRGNQQFSPAVIRAVGLENITVVAAKSKIAALQGRPLLVDTNDAALDLELAGYRPVITGYRDQILYRVASID
jgi:predicted polyphosphate/ATP-dependent NAD kinase